MAGVLWAGLGRGDREDLFRSLGILTEVVHLVENNYVDELKPEALALSLDAGLVEGVDSWASVVPSNEAEAFRDMQRAMPAYGLVLSSRLGSAAVRSCIKGSPAEASGLKSWEVIEKLDGVYTRGRPLRQIRMELYRKYRKGSTVRLRVVDRRVDEKRDVELEAAAWEPDTYDLDEHDGISRLSLHCLPEGTAKKIREEVSAEGPIIVDLRDLLWGDEDEAVAFIDLFAAEGETASWKGRKAGEKTYKATPFLRFRQPPMVLIGMETEDIGEIVAAGLRRAGARLIGGTTMGHAPHMDYVDGGDFELWMPVGLWLNAGGEKINGTGIKADEEVKAGDEDSGEDPVLDRALKLIREERAAGAKAA